ncbi:hypothetical protein PIIN_01647 [Serendipita indica DSM 11827]|uniref:Protein kinase domain-containing protein n=1 Tax=Serendipita indica (strain DSM 11827) TaxID=1109443 RepID=G4T914_SERID|nr:hypothetical protein PIIN_01647 [Serendipita indica DSM 11827]
MSDTTPENITSNVFSMTDESLANRYKFVKEHGVGNWGSVWLATDKTSASQAEGHPKVAIKVVHRSKTQTTAARVRALWNEMKVVRSFKEDCHPSIVKFHEFIISPSYALIVMEFLPKALPVPAAETRAKTWFVSLSSAVHFLHEHGVVHNDIKPANILLSKEGVPKLVDFGFSECYGLSTPDAFRSSLAYGTPEYLSPERARGQFHDSRKSDVWALGVTFFEIIMGRTPFESDRGEQFISKDELDIYWKRTYKGKWLVSNNESIRKKMSRPLESLLRRMLAPNADVRVTASQIVSDPYWSTQTIDCLIPSSDSETVTKRLGNPTRATLSSKSNARNSGRASVNKTRASNDYSSGKENRPPQPKSPTLRHMGLSINAGSRNVEVRSPSLCNQESTGVREIAEKHVKQIPICEDQVEGAAQGVKDAVAGSTSQSLPPLPAIGIPFHTRMRASDAIISASTQPRAVGFSVDLNSPQQLHGRRALRHMASDQYPFNERSIDGARVEATESRHSLRTVRRTRSDMEMTQSSQPNGTTANGHLHKRTPSYNSLAIERANIVAIPEVHVEEADDLNTVVATDSDATRNDDSESYYDRLLVESHDVERVGKGYQSNLCTRNDHKTSRKSAAPSSFNAPPSELKKKISTSQFLNSVREQARPRRKMRQAASFDGIGVMRRQETPNLARPRPVSANLEAMSAHNDLAKSKEKKKSVAGTMYKALLTLVGAREKPPKAH